MTRYSEPSETYPVRFSHANRVSDVLVSICFIVNCAIDIKKTYANGSIERSCHLHRRIIYTPTGDSTELYYMLYNMQNQRDTWEEIC